MEINPTPNGKPFMIRQGDVMIVAAGSIPGDSVEVARDKGRVILAYGEVTGHAHALVEDGVKLLTNERLTERFLQVLEEGGAILRHEEHTHIVIPPGNYKVIQQREHDLASGEVRNVAD